MRPRFNPVLPPQPKACPIHGTALEGCPTKYGMRYSCPAEGCTIYCWSGATSTPATPETHAARKAAHAAFDPLWQSGRMRRTEAYAWLGAALGLAPEDTHIGMFSREQAQAVVRAIERYLNPL